MIGVPLYCAHTYPPIVVQFLLNYNDFAFEESQFVGMIGFAVELGESFSDATFRRYGL